LILFRDKKEIDIFIDQLNSTLNALNLNKYESETEIEDIKDEVFEDLEEEALKIESEQNEQLKKESNNINQIAIDQSLLANKPNSSNKTEENGQKVVYLNSDLKIIKQNDKDQDFKEEEWKATLGATNHMQNRINCLEKYYYYYSLFFFIFRFKFF
jgi:hypothetical protein